MPEVMVDGVPYVPAENIENLKRWHAEALARLKQLEEANEASIKLLAQARHDLAKAKGGQ